MAELSDLFKQLDMVGTLCYKEKLGMLGVTTDPYSASRDVWDYNPSRWPDLSFPDICAYLIHSLSPYTKEAIKAYKSTEAWAYFTAGYVSEVGLLHLTPQTCLLSAMVRTVVHLLVWACQFIVKFVLNFQVKHIQKMTSPPLRPWIGVQYDGTVICAHCNCMAGAGEACSHIAALLYAVMAKANLMNETACTSVRCSWLQPSHNAQVICVCQYP